jgi:hypothetical protein
LIGEKCVDSLAEERMVVDDGDADRIGSGGHVMQIILRLELEFV